MSSRDSILQQALALDPEDRAFVADELERSLPVTGFASEEIADAWAKEIDRRIDRYLRGESKAVSFEESLQFLRKSLDEHRVHRAVS